MGAKDLGSVQIVLTSLICVRGLPINSCTFNMLVLKHSFWKPHNFYNDISKALWKKTFSYYRQDIMV